MISRRDFLKGLGIGALAVAAPVVGRRIWQAHRDAPVRAAKIYSADGVRWQDTPLGDVVISADEVRASFDGVEFPPLHYQCRSTLSPLTKDDYGWLENLPEMKKWLGPRVHYGPPRARVEYIETEIGFSL